MRAMRMGLLAIAVACAVTGAAVGASAGGPEPVRAAAIYDALEELNLSQEQRDAWIDALERYVSVVEEQQRALEEALREQREHMAERAGERAADARRRAAVAAERIAIARRTLLADLREILDASQWQAWRRRSFDGLMRRFEDRLQRLRPEIERRAEDARAWIEERLNDDLEERLQEGLDEIQRRIRTFGRTVVRRIGPPHGILHTLSVSDAEEARKTLEALRRLPAGG